MVMHIKATDDNAMSFITGPYDTLDARLAADEVVVDWSNAWPVVDKENNVIDITTADDTREIILVDRTDDGWKAYDGASDAAMWTWVAEDLGIVNVATFFERIDRDQLAKQLHHLMHDYDGGEAWSLYINPKTAEISVDRTIDLPMLLHEFNLHHVMSSLEVAEWCAGYIPVSAEEWGEDVEDFITYIQTFDQVENALP